MQILTQKRDIFLIAILCAISLAISFLTALIGPMVCIVVIGLLFSATLVIIVISDFKIGFLILLTYSFFLFHLGRLLSFPFPFGIFVEALYLLVFISVLVHKYRSTSIHNVSVFRNPIGYAIILFTAYAFLELLNPNSSSISARGTALRETLSILISFYVVMHVFDSLKMVRLFTKVWLFLAMLAALYGMYQEYFGFQPFEIRWAASTPGAFKPIWGRIRKWSFLSDVSAYGLFMAYSATICFVLALAKVENKKRLVLICCGIIMAVSMTYSGTRTAFAMVALGLCFYVFMSLNDRRTLIFAAAAVIIFLGIIFGPFYGPTFSRMRSTFNTSEDASMGVRDGKRLRLQPYARENPFGGGINTAGNVGMRYEPSHPLSGPFDPDSGYLKMALERGWIGLLINLTLYAVVLIYGLINFHKVKNNEIRFYYAAYMSGFFALSIAHFTQDAMDQKPVVVILISSCALFVRLIEFDNIKTEKLTHEI